MLAAVPISWFLTLSAVLFALGVAGFVFRRNIITVFMSIELMLNAGAEAKKGRSFTAQLLGLPLLVAFLGLMAYFVQRLFPRSTMVHFGGFRGGGAAEIGHALFTTFLLPFEVTSILILVAILGAIVLARKEMD